MFDEKKFRAAVLLAGKTMHDVAVELNIAESTLYRKILRQGDFSREEIQVLINYLNIEDAMNIFFAAKLA